MKDWFESRWPSSRQTVLAHHFGAPGFQVDEAHLCVLVQVGGGDGQGVSGAAALALARPAAVRAPGAAGAGQRGLPAARTQAFVLAGRVFLESERFDRHSPWQSGAAGLPPGRIGMVSLMVYDAEYVGETDNWAATALRMEARGLLLPEDARTLRLLDAYGRLIGNTDRHYGNISLVLVDDDWPLSPTYDMLPMLYMPIAGELVAQELAVQQMAPTAAMLEVWPQAQALALAFWQAVAQEARISAGFREIAQGHEEALAGVLGVSEN